MGHSYSAKSENDSHFQRSRPPMKNLSTAPLNQWVRIARLDGPHEDCNRLLDLGLTPGEEIAVAHTAPLGDPLIVRVRGALLALRKREAAWILVE